ncbi:MAG: fumarate hydratase [Halobacteriota archaeon]
MSSNREAFIRHTAQALQEVETHLPRDVTRALANAAKAESDERAKEQIGAILENVRLAGVPLEARASTKRSVCARANVLYT